MFGWRQLGARASEPDEHEPQKSQIYEGFAGARQSFIIAGEPQASDQPGKGPLDQPALGMDGQARWPDQWWLRNPIHPAESAGADKEERSATELPVPQNDSPDGEPASCSDAHDSPGQPR